MSSINDIMLGEFANLAYVDFPKVLEEELEKEVIPLKDLADISIGKYLDKEKKWGNICLMK